MSEKPQLHLACLLFMLVVASAVTTPRLACADDLSSTGLSSTGLSSTGPPSPEKLAFFERHVRPLLAEHCYQCHSTRAKKLQAGLKLDSRSSLLSGGDSGPAVVPGEVDTSLLIEAVRYESYEMPPKGKLPEQAIQTLETWVRMGAPWPEEQQPTGEENRDDFDLAKRKTEHWSWQPIQMPDIPAVGDEPWPQAELDHFILHRLEQAGLRPATDTDRHALIR
ncbi:MAG: c-type cytochrome domain-containing protein, partial [Bythopirellula sp.]